MEYCKRCLYPANAKPTIILDDEGVCSGCRYHESRQGIDWNEREAFLRDLLAEHKAKAREAGNPYDCIIPVGGGKDSHFQTHLMKNVYGMNPLLVTYNHTYNTALGLRNLNNLVKQFGCDLVRFTTSPETARKVSRYMLKQCGDVTWHYHSGIRTFPFQIAVMYNIPLVILGEHGFAELVGMVTLEDMVEHTQWTRREMDQRGFDAWDLVNEESGITEHEIKPFTYPSEEDIERVGVRGIYMSNFFDWDAKKQAELMHEKYDFEFFKSRRERTFVLSAKTDDHANDVHDYLKYLKFGYGRATDDASTEIRHGRMTREEGIEMVRQYDANRPRSLDTYLDWMGISEQEFLDAVEPMRDTDLWEKQPDGTWQPTDSVVNHANDEGVGAVRPTPVPEDKRTFSAANRELYYSETHWAGREEKVGGSERPHNDDDLVPIIL
ncbi:N-acetyl sugar amidotransferase [bacterium]|nr:N-acetyl sugar amidotransferase [bacterium]